MINLIKERGWKMKHYGDVSKINGAKDQGKWKPKLKEDWDD